MKTIVTESIAYNYILDDAFHLLQHKDNKEKCEVCSYLMDKLYMYFNKALFT